jgi:hypothetical protein
MYVWAFRCGANIVGYFSTVRLSVYWLEMIFVADYLHIDWRLSVYCLRLSVYWLEIIFVADYLYIDWRLSVYCLKLSVYWLKLSVYWLEIIFVAHYLYIDLRLYAYCLRLSVYWLVIIFTLFEMISVLVGDYLCTGWNSGILCTVCNTFRNFTAAVRKLLPDA